MTDLEKWESGFELGDAYIKFCNPFQVEKFRKASSFGAIHTYKVLMFSELFAMISSREFEAFGFQIKPNPVPGPIRIPNHVFVPRPDVNLAENDTVSASGYEYERVRILPLDAEQISGTKSTSIEYGKIGRPSTYSKAREALNALFQIESNRGKSAAKLHRDFQAEFEKQFPIDKWGVAAPSERNLQDHLKRYRQELAESGSNDFSN